MSYTNRYSSYQGLNNYKSYSYTTQPITRTQPPSSIWTRPPRYMPTSSSVTFSTTTAAPAPPKTSIITTIETTPVPSKTTVVATTTSSSSALALSLPPAVTDELHAEVDYNMNEIDSIMICRGSKLIEIQSGELSEKKGLIAKCLFINNLLKAANLCEQHLSADPAFIANESKVIIKFLRTKDAEEFINSHNYKYRIMLQQDRESPESLRQSNHGYTANSNTTTMAITNLPVKYDNGLASSLTTYEYDKNSSKVDLTRTVKIDDVVTKTTFTNDIISNEPLNGQTTFSFTFSDDNNNATSSSSGARSGFNDNNFNDDINFETQIETSGGNANANSVVVKRDQIEGYETLTIKAKLKQRVGPNRTKHVTLKDIDSIMRNVVTVVQNEFMKRFPSATSVNCNTSSSGSSNIPSITNSSSFY